MRESEESGRDFSLWNTCDSNYDNLDWLESFDVQSRIVINTLSDFG